MPVMMRAAPLDELAFRLAVLDCLRTRALLQRQELLHKLEIKPRKEPQDGLPIVLGTVRVAAGD
jgi:hypothetical protein